MGSGSERADSGSEGVPDGEGGDAPAIARLVELLFRDAPVGLGILDRSFRFLVLNELLARSNGIPIDRHVGRSPGEIMPEHASRIQQLCAEALAGRAVHDAELLGARPGTTDVHHWLLSCIPLRRSDRSEPEAIGVVLVDDTERRRVQDALSFRTDLNAMMASTNRAVAERRSPEALFAELCRIAVQMGHFQCAWVGVPDGDRLRRVVCEGVDGGYLDSLVVSLDEADARSQGPAGLAWRTGESRIENDFLGSPSTVPWHEAARRVGFESAAAFPLRERDRVAAVLVLYSRTRGFFTPELVDTLGELSSSVSLALDAFLQEQQRRRDEEELRLRDRAIRAVRQGICISDARAPDQPVIFVSPGFEQLTGYAAREIIGQNCRFLQGPDTDPLAVRELHEAVHAGRACTVTLLNYRRDGTPFWNEVAISPVFAEDGTLTHLVGVQTDVTERRRLELQMRHAQKMEAVGQLASGVAHDFNNLLTVVHTCSHLLLEALEGNPELRELAQEISDAGERGVSLTRQLLAFSRKQVRAPRVLDVDAVVAGSERMLRRLLGEDIQLTTRLHGDLWRVRIDEGELVQLLINLAVNARDAMPRGGQLAIETDMTVVPERGGEHAPGEYVTMTMTDSGHGMDDETMRRIFDPFFTTKPAGKGTGLGLATVAGIVESAGGFVTVRSSPGQGTAFRVCLPRVPAEEGVPAPTPAVAEMLTGTETILLVEDDVVVRESARRILERAGYSVLVAADGLQALEVVRARSGDIALLVTDVIMPHLGGRELAERVRALLPGCRVLFVSGYTDDETLRHGVIDAGVELLPKPYTPVEFTQRVRDVLDARR